MANGMDSGASTPGNSRFTSQAHTMEDRLKADTVGLVQLSDFRKRRAEALEAAQDSDSSLGTSEGRTSVVKPMFKKKKKVSKPGGLSFDDEEDGDEGGKSAASLRKSKAIGSSATAEDAEQEADAPVDLAKKRSFKPNAAVGFVPRAMTKSALSKEAQLKDVLKKEYTQLQEAVKATEFMLPFVFYDGKNVPGGICRMKKGDFIWVFLEQARKVGAELARQGDKARKDWARISVDDLMVVKSDIIIPHHYDFHYFMVNRTVGYKEPLFPHASVPTATTPKHLLPNSAASVPVADTPAGLETAAERAERVAAIKVADDSDLEGFSDDPNLTKVVDRRWYERNKHVFPASSWEEFDPSKDYSTAVRKDALGNAMFFAR